MSALERFLKSDLWTTCFVLVCSRSELVGCQKFTEIGKGTLRYSSRLPGSEHIVILSLGDTAKVCLVCD